MTDASWRVSAYLRPIAFVLVLLVLGAARAQAQTADLSVTKSVTPDPVFIGTNIAYTIIVTNNGPNAATNFVLSDFTPANTTFASLIAPPGFFVTTPAVGGTGTITATIVSLPVGVPMPFALVVNVNPLTPDGTVIVNTATVASATSDLNPANNAATVTSLAVLPTADVSVTKTDTPDPVAPGANITYTITVANTGPGTAANLALTDAIPTNTTFVSFIAPAGYTVTSPPVGAIGTITATRPSLAVGASSVFTLVVNVNAATSIGTTITNMATVSTTSTDPNAANNSDTESTTVAGATADLSVTKTDTPDPVLPGQTITFTYTVTNTGPSAAANVALTDAVPANTTFVSFTAPAGFTSTTPVVGGTGAITSTAPSIAAGQTVTFTFVVQVNPATPAGTIITGTATLASATTDPNAANNTATSTTTVAAAVPTLLQWQLLALAVLIGLIAVSQLRRRTQALS